MKLTEEQRLKRNEYQLSWYRKNREKAIAWMRRWRGMNPEKIKGYNESGHARMKLKPDLRKEYTKRYVEKYPERRRAVEATASAARRRRLKSSERISIGLVKKLMELQNRKCACCEVFLKKYHVDHIMPLALGGSNEDKNIQLLCPPCNLRKHSKHPVDFMQELGRLL